MPQKIKTPSQKSSRHSKIAGDFGEMLVLYYLSRYGFECARIDHTGIDLLARTKSEARPWGISVKTVSREEHRKGRAKVLEGEELDDAVTACAAFNATPYIAIVFDGIESVCVLLRSIEELRSEKTPRKNFSFSFDAAHKALYRSSKYSGRFIEMTAELGAWKKEPSAPIPPMNLTATDLPT